MENKQNFRGSLVAFGIGVLLLLSGAHSHQSPTVAGGLTCLVWTGAYFARKKQFYGSSKIWLLLEIPCLLLATLLVLGSITKSNWYVHPISYMLVPLWGLVAYVSILSKRRPIKLQ